MGLFSPSEEAYLSSRVQGAWITRSLALALVVVGIRILLMAF